MAQRPGAKAEAPNAKRPKRKDMATTLGATKTDAKARPGAKKPVSNASSTTTDLGSSASSSYEVSADSADCHAGSGDVASKDSDSISSHGRCGRPEPPVDMREVLAKTDANDIGSLTDFADFKPIDPATDQDRDNEESDKASRLRRLQDFRHVEAAASHLLRMARGQIRALEGGIERPEPELVDAFRKWLGRLSLFTFRSLEIEDETGRYNDTWPKDNTSTVLEVAITAQTAKISFDICINNPYSKYGGDYKNADAITALSLHVDVALHKLAVAMVNRERVDTDAVRAERAQRAEAVGPIVDFVNYTDRFGKGFAKHLLAAVGLMNEALWQCVTFKDGRVEVHEHVTITSKGPR